DSRVKDELSAIGGPAGKAADHAAHISKLTLVRTVSITKPDFPRSGAKRLESDLLSVRREARVVFVGRRRDPGENSENLLIRVFCEPDLPEVYVGCVAAVYQSLA